METNSRLLTKSQTTCAYNLTGHWLLDSCKEPIPLNGCTHHVDERARTSTIPERLAATSNAIGRAAAGVKGEDRGASSCAGNAQTCAMTERRGEVCDPVPARTTGPAETPEGGSVPQLGSSPQEASTLPPAEEGRERRRKPVRGPWVKFFFSGAAIQSVLGKKRDDVIKK